MDLLSELQHAEFKEAFDEFDKVRKSWLMRKIFLIGNYRPTENGVSKSEKWFCLKFENFTIFSSQVA